MPYTVLIHMAGEDAVVGEMEELPEPGSRFLTVKSPRLRDGRDVSYLLPETNTVLYPWTRIHCVEILSGESEEEIVTFIRE